MSKAFFKLASPQHFYCLSVRAQPWLVFITLISLFYGVLSGLMLAPADYQQGDAFRVMYVHVPCAALSLGVYMLMAFSAAVAMIWRVKVMDVIAQQAAPLGAMFTALALVTGSIWGKPMWGTWWIWDARLTSELILLFLYIGYMALRSAIPDRRQAMQASSILLFVGVVDIPIIHYSVNWWNTLHQRASLLAFQKPTIAPSMLYPLIVMFLGFSAYFLVLLSLRVRKEILHRERDTQWVKTFLAGGKHD